MSKPIPAVVANPNNTAEHQVPETIVNLATPITVPALQGKAELDLSYTPDRELVTPTAFLAWLDELVKHGQNETWEELAGAIIDIFYDTLLPKHVALNLYIQGNKIQHAVEMVKQQPREH